MKKILPILGIKNIASDEMVKKGLEKVFPKFKRFFSESAKYGYPLGATLGFLKSEFSENPEPINPQLRPDESANIELKRQSEVPQRLAKTAANVGIGAALGGAGGAALSGIASMGQNKQQNIENVDIEQTPNPSSSAQSFINKHPELGIFLDQQMSQGKTPQQAALSAKQHKKYANDVSAIERDVGMDFVDLINQIFSDRPKQQKPDQANQSLVGLLDMLKQFQKARKGG